MQQVVKGICIMGLATTCGAGTARININETEEAGAKLFHIENDFYHAVFAPAQAMFPLYYHFKPTAKDMLVRKPDVAASFRSRDGIQLCLPCVGGVKDRLPSKGFLNTSDWQTSLTGEADRAVLTAKTSIAYDDPVSGTPARLDATVTVTGRAGSSRLSTDFLLHNTGEHPARLMFVAHARLAPEGGYQAGDYIFTPAQKCWVSDFQWPALADAGVTPHAWTAWPVPGMDTFAPKPPAEKRGDFAYAFIPTRELVVGNDRTGNFLAFHATEVKIGAQTQPEPYFCILRRDGDYLVEVSVSRELDAKYWEMPGATVTLPPGEQLAFTLHMTAGQGLRRDEALRATAPNQ